MSTIRIAVIGLGYVGLPLARLFSTKYPVVGFDINKKRVAELMTGFDSTLEVDEQTLKAALLDYNPTFNQFLSPSKDNPTTQQPDNTDNNDNNDNNDNHHNPTTKQNGLYCSTSPDDIRDCNFYIVTVPTPVDRNNRPDLGPLLKASETVGLVIKKGDVVVYESTVYPGATEEDCIPVVERVSGLKYNVDFFAGYSPERINPGDKEHTVEKIKKVTSGSTPETGEKVDAVYRSVITAGTHLAPSIKVAEAAKVIENSQRDINIAFVNELAKIFNLMKIDTQAVLEAAGTKWNFLPFRPGLVGGHCIGVDPFYLAQKAQEYGYHPEIILAGRRINDSMGKYVATEVIKLLIKKGTSVKGAKILMLGITFKENCPDIRNTKAIDIYHELREYGVEVDVYDPWADPDEVKHEYGIKTSTEYPEEGFLSIAEGGYAVVVLAVAHQEFLKVNWSDHKKNGCIVFDVKGMLDVNLVNGRL